MSAASNHASDCFGVRGMLLDYTGDPTLEPRAVRVESDGLLVIADGKIVARGAYADLRDAFPELTIEDYSRKVICAGFIDAHVHYPQLNVIARYGHQLLDWLATYTFPAEREFADALFASQQAQRFVREMVRHGTTTALTLCTVHPESVDALAEAALAIDMRLILGKVLMDRNAPAELLDTPQRAYDESCALIARWHGRNRLSYAITPRFAGTSSPEQLSMAAAVKAQHPSTYVHTHLAENRAEVAWMRQLFPERSSYTDIYAHFGLLGERTVLAHGIYLGDDELSTLAQTGSVIAFCPTSNLFLGSGLFPYQKTMDAGVRLALATDVGAGTSLSMLRTMGEAYKVLQLQQTPLTAHAAWFQATLGNAQALGLQGVIGALQPGHEADFVVLDWSKVPLLEERARNASSLEDLLFALMILGDDRVVHATFVNGVRVFSGDASE